MRRMLHFWYEDMIRDLIFLIWQEFPPNFDLMNQAEQLDLHKSKATDLLRAHEGDVTRAIRAFIAPSIRN